MKQQDKVPYICGPLTELSKELGDQARDIYLAIAEITRVVLDKRAFVPHEHYDPLVNINASPQEVYKTESDRIKHQTSLLIVVAIAPSWGGGGEIQLANEYNVPIIICHPKGKKISRYILGMEMVHQDIIEYNNITDLTKRLLGVIKTLAL